MPETPDTLHGASLSRFDRHFFTGTERLTVIGSGSIGGKAHGLARIKHIIDGRIGSRFAPAISVNIPTLAVIATDFFDAFVSDNSLRQVASSGLRDDQIALAFQRAALPAQLVGDLRALIAQVHTPLAVRSSSMLEDAMFEPFASVYVTKMIPNNQIDADTRFRKLVEAVKFVYASTFFKHAQNYIRATRHEAADEKMAVIIQEVVGSLHNHRFYPQISGVARSYNFYPSGPAKPEDGVVDLALGLGKIIVDDGIAWSYSPAYPQANPPYNTLDDLLDMGQREFWAIRMGEPPAYDPIREVEYIQRYSTAEAEADGNLAFVASTYRAEDDKIVPGIIERGPRLLDFASILKFEQLPLNNVIRELLKVCEETLSTMVEIEFAVTLDQGRAVPARLGFLQVRPMVVSHALIDVPAGELVGSDVLVASEAVLGNGMITDIQDVVYIKPETFDVRYTEAMAGQLERINRGLLEARRPYLLVGFGRWGTTDPAGGIPVNFGQISGARVIVEVSFPNMNFMLSQGSHFFHNITSFRVCYFSIDPAAQYRVDWDWLGEQPTVSETEFTRHVRLARPLTIKVDGRKGRGVIRHA